MSYIKKVFEGTVITVIATFIASGLGYGLKLFLARSFSVEEFGLIFAVLAFFNLLTVFYNFGLESALVRFIPEFKVNSRHKDMTKIFFSSMVFQVGIALALGIFVFVFRKQILLHFFKTEISTFILTLGVIYLVFSPVNLVQAILRGQQRIKYHSLFLVLKNLFVLLAAIFVFNIMDAEHKNVSLLIAYILFHAVTMLFLFFYLFAKTKDLFGIFDMPLLKKAVSFGVPIFMVSIFSMIFSKMDTLFITYFAGLEEVGFYNVADSTVGAILSFLGAFSVIFVPIVSELWSKKDKKTLETTIGQLVKYTAIISIPILFLVLFFSEEMVTVLFGEKFIPASIIMLFYAPAIILSPLNKVFAPVLLSASETKYIGKISLISFGIDFIGNILLVPLYGARGATASSILGMLSLLFLIVRRVRFHLKINLPFLQILKAVLSSVVFILLFSFIFNRLSLDTIYRLIISGLLSGIPYACLIFLFKIITIEEIRHLFDFSRKGKEIQEILE